MSTLNESILQSAGLSESILQVLRIVPIPGIGAEAGTEESILAVSSLIKNDGRYLPSSCMAGLWLLVGELDRSHKISQDLSTPNGSYWHGIMHRREGDYWNAKYWFRKVGEHPVFDKIGRCLIEANKSGGEDCSEFLDDRQRFCPNRFTDAVEQQLAKKPKGQIVQGTKESDRSELLRRVAWLEWQCLFAECAQTD